MQVRALQGLFCLFGDVDALDHNGFHGPVHAVGRGPRNLINYVLGGLVNNFAENGVAHVQVRRRCHCDEELGAICSWPGICHCQQVGAIELEFWVEFITKHVAGAAATGTGGVAALDHKSIDHAVKYCTIVEWASGFTCGVCGAVFFGTLCQTNEVFHCFWGVISKEFDDNVATVRVQNRGSCLKGHVAYRSELCNTSLRLSVNQFISDFY